MPFTSPGAFPSSGIEPGCSVMQTDYLLPESPVSLYIYIYASAQLLQSCPTLLPPGLEPARLLYPWDPPGKNTGVGCHFLLQGIFLTQGSNPQLLHWQADSLPLNHVGSPMLANVSKKIHHSRFKNPIPLDHGGKVTNDKTNY